MTGLRDLRLGRLQLPTAMDDISEAVGDALDTVGGGVVPGERRARSFGVTLPIHGTPGDADPYTIGLQMRRQLRSMMENTRLKLLGIYLNFTPDTELNSWLIIGAGDLKYGQGGVTVADFQLDLADCYKVGSRRSHRVARRVELYDRRLTTTARDILGQWYGSDWAGLTALPIVYLPVGAADVTGAARRVIALGSRRALNGQIGVVVLPTVPTATSNHGEVLSFEQAEAFIHGYDDVVVYDRRGTSDPLLSYSARVLQDDPRIYYRLDEGAAAVTALDSSEWGINGVYVGVPNMRQPGSTADSDTAAGLAGPDGVYVRTGDDPVLRVTGDLTIEGVILPLGGAPNLVVNSSVEVDTLGWANAVTSGGASFFGRSSGWSDVGGAALRATAAMTAAAGQNSIYWANQADPGLRMDVKPGQPHTLHASVNVVGAVAGTVVRATIEYYDAADALLVTADSDVSVAAGGVFAVTVTAAAPVDASYARIYFKHRGTGGTTPAAWTSDFYVDAITFVQGSLAVSYANTRPRFDTIVSKWRSVAGGRAYRFAYDSYRAELIFQQSTDGNSVTTSYSFGGSLTTGSYHHLAVTNYGGEIRFYRNGVNFSQTLGAVTQFAAPTKLTIAKWEADA